MHRLVTVIALALLCLGQQSFAQVGKNADLADPNLISTEDLVSLPHVTDALATIIVEGRPYLSAEAFNAVLAAALDEEQRRDVYQHVFRAIDLNAASDSEIMLIPGMSRRMAHEFEEYRPYRSLEQFRREIGKYVDADEVARLEQYVFIPLNLNEASAEDIASIPGMTPRMVHEFEEYRPYRSMEQFRREIGKYVDKDEVARLESYVTLD